MDAGSAQTRSETPGEAKEKVRLKFRVSAGEGVSNGVPFPRWSEKWSVGLFDYEEFHVTDQLIKLPFQETPPETVCIFSIAQGALRFRMVDADRVAHVNGEERKEALLAVGDRLRLAETVTIEVLIAPKIAAREEPLAAAPEVGRDPEEGPTLTLTEMSAPIEEDPDGPVFAKTGRTILIEEPTGDRVNPLLKAKARAFEPEPKVELADPTPPERFEKKKSREEPEEDEPSFEPVYADAPDLDAAKPSFSERILAAIARVLRRDEVDPPNDRFPLDPETRTGIRRARAAGEPSPNAGSPSVVARPAGMTPAPIRFHDEPKVELDFGEKGPPTGPSATGSGAVVHARPEPKPWIPAAESPGARLRGRAMVFVAAAGITLAIAAGFYLSVGKWMDRRAASQASATVDQLADGDEPFERGLPIEVIEEKVRRMRR